MAEVVAAALRGIDAEEGGFCAAD